MEPADDAGPRLGEHHEPGRTPSDIRAIVVAHRDEIRACYRASLKDSPGLEGSFVAKWTIDPKGAVSVVAVETLDGGSVPAALEDCVAGAIKRISFAPSQGGFETRTRYPFNFHSRAPAPTP